MPELINMTSSEPSDESRPPQFITTTQVAQRFGVDSSAVRKWIAEGRIKPAVTTPGGHHRFRLCDVEALLGQEASA